MTTTMLPANNEPLLQASDVTIAKSGHIVLHEVTLTLESGALAALVGPSGSGKTSLLRVLALLDDAVTGTVCLWGQDYPAAKADHGRVHAPVYPRLNYVPQTLGLWPHLTIRENLTFAVTDASAAQSSLDDLCAELDIVSILNRRPPNASQGQRQRAALARALLLRPQILLLDEVTAALDRSLANIVWELLGRFVANGGAILASTHDSYLAEQCNRLYRIATGRLVSER